MSRLFSLIPQKYTLRFFVIVVSVAALGACSSGSSSDGAAPDPTIETPIADPVDVTPPEVTSPDDALPPVVVTPPADDVGEVDDEDDDTPAHPPRPHAVDYYDRPYDYPDVAVLPLQYFPTINGKQLGVRVMLPADENGNALPGPFPTILVQTGYNMYSMSLITMNGGGLLLGMKDPYLVRHGYAIAVVDVYGTGVSQGGWTLFGEEEQAGYRDSVDWVVQQPWYNGSLGVAGYSYMAISALWTAEQRPDQIKAVFAGSPIGDAQRGIVGSGGMLNGVFLSTWMVFTQWLSTKNDIALLQNPELASLIESATQEHIDQIDDYFMPLIDGALNGDPEITYSGHFWHSRSPLEHADAIRAPTIVTGALQDIFQRDAPLWYEQLKKNTDTRLVIYDSDHIRNFIQLIPGGDEIDPMLPIALQWFDKYLKGMDVNVSDIAPVTQFVKNHKRGAWSGFVATTDWPHPEMTPQRWYLHGDLTVDTHAPDVEEDMHYVDAAPQPVIAVGKSDDGERILIDYTAGDGTRCSVSYRQWTLGIAGLLTTDGISPNEDCYNTNTELEKDALNFETAPMADDYYINGPIQADIWLETTGENAVLSVWLDAITPEGESLPISNGLLLASARAVDESRSRFINGEMIQPYFYFTQDQELTVVPGEVMKMQVEIFPTSYIIPKGYKLRVSIASSNQAQGILTYPRQAQVIGSTMTLHNSAEYPSSVLLPAVPLSALQ